MVSDTPEATHRPKTLSAALSGSTIAISSRYESSSGTIRLAVPQAGCVPPSIDARPWRISISRPAASRFRTATRTWSIATYSVPPCSGPLLAQLLPCDGADRAPSALLLEPAVPPEALKVLRRRWAGNVRFAPIDGVHYRQPDQSLVERNHQSLSVALLARELLAEIVAGLSGLPT